MSVVRGFGQSSLRTMRMAAEAHVTAGPEAGCSWSTLTDSYWFTPDAAANPAACGEGIVLAGGGAANDDPSALIAVE